MSLILASRATVYDRYAISRKFTAQETAINVIQGNISLLISASEIEELKNGDKTMYSKLSAVEMDLNSINLAVSSSEYKDINGVLSAITQAKASIELNSQEIELKVSKDSLISTINQSAEAVSIDANKINLNGVVTANENFKILQDGSMEAKNGLFRGDIQIEVANRFERGVRIHNKITGESGTLQAGYLGVGGMTTNGSVMYVNIFGGDDTDPNYGNPFILLYNDGVQATLAPDYLHIKDGNIWCKSLRVTETIHSGGLYTSNAMLSGTTRQNGDMYIVGNLFVNGKQIN